MIKAEIRDELTIAGELVKPARETQANSNGKIQLELKIKTDHGYRTVYIPKGFATNQLVTGNNVVIEFSQPLAGLTGYINEGEEVLHGIDPTTGKLWEGLIKGQELSPKLENLFSYSQKENELNKKLTALESLSEEKLEYLTKYNTVAQLV